MSFGPFSPETTSNATDSRAAQDGVANKQLGARGVYSQDSGIALGANTKFSSGNLTIRGGKGNVAIGDTTGATNISRTFSDTIDRLNNTNALLLSSSLDIVKGENMGLREQIERSFDGLKDLADNKQSDGAARFLRAGLWIAFAVVAVVALKIWRK